MNYHKQYEAFQDAVKEGGEGVWDIGNIVVCDLCNDDYTTSDEEVGIYFHGYSACPRCAPQSEEDMKKYNEEDSITDRAKPGEKFREFVYRLRNGNNLVIVTGGNPS